MMTRSIILLLAIFLATAPAIRADEPKATPGIPVETFSDPKPIKSANQPKKQLTDQEIKSLIDKLVSPNPKPITGDEDRKEIPDYRLPPGYDREKQKLVHEARKELKSAGINAFPFLIERWNDKRYSLTMASVLSGYSHNYSVGKVCQIILFDQLQPYGYWQKNDGRDPREKALRPMYPEKFLSSQKEVKKWWDQNKDKSLAQIQLEILDWVIAEEAKEEKGYSDEERKYLQEIREKLAKNKKELPPGNYFLLDKDN